MTIKKNNEDDDIDIQFLGEVLHTRGFKSWFLFFFKQVEGQKFIVEPIHHDLFKCFQDIYELKNTRQVINIPPRSSKTSMAIYFIAYALAKDLKCNFIYTSFSQELLASNSKRLATILNNKLYQEMYLDNNISEEQIDDSVIDDFWKNYYKLNYNNVFKFTSKQITTKEGGVILFNSIGSSITGFGCFEYNTLVLTEKGYLKLGDIVENKLDIKVYSYNFEKKKIELKKILRYIKNINQPFLKITLDNKEEIKATPDHVFYLSNGEEKRADELKLGFCLFSDFFNFTNRYIKYIRNMFTRIISIKNKFYLFWRKSFKKIISKSFATSPISNSISYSTPIYTRFNIRNITSTRFKIFCYLLVWSFIFCNFFNLFLRKDSISIMSSMFYTVLFIITLCAICKIVNIIIKRISIKMSNNETIRFTNKSKSHKFVNRLTNPFFIFRKFNTFIIFFINICFQNSIAFFRKNLTILRNKIICKRRYRKIINIINCNHGISYCLTIKDNSNFFITKSKILVHNCGLRNSNDFSGMLILDDPNKPIEVHSERIRNKVKTYFEETLLSRLNNSMVPILNIQQRLHLEDLSGFLIKEYGFDVLKRPLVDEKGVCQLPQQYTEKRIEELKKNNYLFTSQYQQEPIRLGGTLIKTEWFRIYNEPLERYKQIYIVCDTAFSTKTSADNSAFMLVGITFENNLHILDMYVNKMDFVELKRNLINFYDKAQTKYSNFNMISAIYIENKASGQSIIQELRQARLPVKELYPTYWNAELKREQVTDKYTRFLEISTDIENGYVYIPEHADWVLEFLAECESFDGLGTYRDDRIDCLIYALKVRRQRQDIDWDKSLNEFNYY